MSTPSHRTRIRSALKAMTNEYPRADAAEMAVQEAVRLSGRRFVVAVASGGLMGAREVAEMLGVQTPNLKHVRGLPEPQERISGGSIPVYRRADIEALRDARRVARDGT